MGIHRSGKRTLDAIEKQARAMELLKEGNTFEVIAEKLGYANRSCAHKAVMTGLKRTLQVPADELRTVHRMRLETMLSAIWWAVRNGDNKAIETALRIMEREAKLIGLDAPIRMDYRHTIIDEARRVAQEQGLDEEAVIAEAERLLGKV